MKNPFSVNRVKKERLLREIMVLSNEIDNFRLQIDSDTNKSEKELAEAKKNLEELKLKIKEANMMLDEAKKAAEEYEFEKSWGYFLNVEQCIVNLLDDTQVQVRAKLLLIESSKKISGWRKDQINFLLGNLCSPRLFYITKDILLKAITIRNDYYLTRSHKMNLHKVNVNILTLSLTMILGVILFFAYFWDILHLNAKLDTPESDDLFKVLIVSGIFGALGAGFSFAKTLFSFNPEFSKVPEQLLSMAVNVTRFVIGASAAIIILLLFNSKFLNGTFTDTILSSPSTYLVFSFVAGFSERWVIKMLGLVTKAKENGNEKEKE